jgi:recombination protein RecA
MARNKKEEVKDNIEDMDIAEKAKLMRDQINAQMKRNVIQQYNSDDSVGVKRISSGIDTLDRILGKGPNGFGWAKGRLHGIHGPEGSGKSTIVLASLAEAQKAGLAVLVDSECVYDPSYAKKLGIDIDSLLVMNPDCSEEAFDTIETLVNSGQVTMVVIDSLDGLFPKAIVEASAEDQFMGLSARVNNRFLGKIVEGLRKNNCTLIIVSQLREKIGGYGSPETVNGGRGLKYYATTRVEIRRDEDIVVSGNKVGHVAKVITRKNKVASPQQTAFFQIDWGEGVNKEKCLVDIAVSSGVINKGGAGWFTFPFNDFKIQGESSLIKELRSNAALKQQLLERINNV